VEQRNISIYGGSFQQDSFKCREEHQEGIVVKDGNFLHSGLDAHSLRQVNVSVTGGEYFCHVQECDNIKRYNVKDSELDWSSVGPSEIAPPVHAAVNFYTKTSKEPPKSFYDDVILDISDVEGDFVDDLSAVVQYDQDAYGLVTGERASQGSGPPPAPAKATSAPEPPVKSKEPPPVPSKPAR
jgi:hypothetical protein